VIPKTTLPQAKPPYSTTATTANPVAAPIYVPEGMFHHNKALPYVMASGVGLGIAVLGAGAYTLANISHSSGRLQQWIQKDLKTMATHMDLQEKGQALKIQYRDLPDSFKSLRTLKLNFDRPFFDDVEVVKNGKRAIEKRLNAKELSEHVAEWIPFIGTLFNGFPRRTRLAVVGYFFSPTFWMKDLFSQDAMWLKKLLSIAGTPAKKITQQLAEVVKKALPLNELNELVASMHKRSNESFKEAFSFNPKLKNRRFEDLKEALVAKFIATMAKPMYVAMNDLQDNAPALPIGVLVKQMTPYFKQQYPNLSLSPYKFKVFAVASVGHIVTHEDLPNRAFKVIRPIDNENLLATGRAIHGVITTLGPEIVKPLLATANLQNPERLNRLMETQEFNTLSYQFCVQFLNGLRKESVIAREFEATKAFRTHYHGRHGLIVPEVFGRDEQNGIIEMELIKDSLSMKNLEARSIDPKQPHYSQEYKRIKTQAFYGILQRWLDFSNTHIVHTDIHSGQIRYQEATQKSVLLDFGAFLSFTPETRQRIVDTLLTAHLNKAYYLKGQQPPRQRSVSAVASKLGSGLNEIQNNRRLTEVFSRLDDPLTFTSIGVMHGLKGDGVNQWAVGYDMKKLNTFGKSVAWEEADLSALNVQERKALQFMTLETLERDVDQLLAAWVGQSSLSFKAGEKASIRESLRNEFLSTFKPYIIGAENEQVRVLEQEHPRSISRLFGRNRKK
jgi:hypothetical protein